ncbi:MAG: hypothetical protein V7K17_15130 [Nostoc sp.]
MRIVNEYIISLMKISDEVIARITVQEERELERRKRLYRKIFAP